MCVCVCVSYFAGKKNELTARDGHVLLLEYLEEQPPLIGRPGMGVKLLTYYKVRTETMCIEHFRHFIKDAGRE